MYIYVHTHKLMHLVHTTAVFTSPCADNAFTLPSNYSISLTQTHTHTHSLTHRVNYSKNAIVKPQGPTAQEAKREVEEAMRKVREATMAIAASIVPLEEVKPAKTKSRSRSR